MMDKLEQAKAVNDFVKRWSEAEQKEEEQARSFWIEFLPILGIDNPTQVLQFERKIKGRKIDVFYPDMGILIEHKSGYVDLDKPRDNGEYGWETPYDQAMWYANNMANSIRPRWIITSNFNTIRIYDLEHPEDPYTEIKLEEIPQKLAAFDFFTNTSASRLVLEKELSIEAGEIVGTLYKSFAEQYKNIENDPKEQLSLNILMVRIVFLLYAEDAGLLQEHLAFNKYLTPIPVSQMRNALIDLFKVLDTPVEDRDPYEAKELLAFPYIDGGLFEKDDIIIPQFTEPLKEDLLKTASQQFNWSGISPTIFGAVFESTLNPETRRQGGMHFTSLENIHKVIDPLFLNDLVVELEGIEALKTEKTRNLHLREFQQKLASINVLDPACGSGNFLTETYLSLRRLENRVIEDLYGEQSMMGFDDDPDDIIKVKLTQFYGIEINDFAVHVAKTALWIAESQMVDATQEIIFRVINFLPLKTVANIVEGNALRMDWNDVLPAKRCSYCYGNPPFIGARHQTKDQKSDVKDAFHESKNCGNVDYVAAWFIKAAEYMKDYPIKCAFVATNSICQGEQVASIWKPIFDMGFHIDFAHDTFRWKNEATNQAHVFVTIVGFSHTETPKRLYHHANPDADGILITPKNINAYLKDAEDFFIENKNKAICKGAPQARSGNKPIDNGNYLFTKDEMASFVKEEPESERYFRPWVGSEEFINGKQRYCLWLGDASSKDLADMPKCRQRIEAVRKYRLNSKSAGTRKIASKPTRFHVETIPESTFLVMPLTSSDRREYVPIGFMSPDIMPSNLVIVVTDATLYHFGILTSKVFMSWMRSVCGRLGNGYRITKDNVYNNFSWPGISKSTIDIPVEDAVDSGIRKEIEQLAQNVLDTRASYDNWTPAKLYDPDLMPADLKQAHHELDMAVERAYGVDFNGDEEKMVSHLFKLYAELTGE